jgi:hypothetical protein
VLKIALSFLKIGYLLLREAVSCNEVPIFIAEIEIEGRASEDRAALFVVVIIELCHWALDNLMRKNLGSRSRPKDVLAQHAPYDLGRSDTLVEMRLHEATERPAEEEIHFIYQL